jgi:AmmeMemoRadiSam system protein B
MAGVREAVVAGTFYPGTEDDLRRQLAALFRHPLGPSRPPEVVEDGPRRLVGLVCPHAGYIYSGAVAAHAFAALAADGRPGVVVIVGPNHHGLGPRVAVSTADAWRTPLGEMAVERSLAQAVAGALPWPAEGEAAHLREHSVEVQLPFLQFLYGDTVPILPIAVKEQSIAVAEALGQALAAALAGRDALIIASTDLSHYEPQRVAQANDRFALDAMVAGDSRRVVDAALTRTSMCGPGPVAATLVAAQALGAVRVEVLKYATSGDAAGDMRQVVGYAALALSK